MSTNNKNNNNDNGTFISRQIAVYKTDKKLIEFIDKLNPAPITTYAHLHAQADDAGEGRKVYSNIGIVLQDYSAGTGDKTIRLTVNISPDEAEYIYSKVKIGIKEFEFSLSKIFGKPDENGYATATKLTITRGILDEEKKPLRYPWCVDAMIGRGIPEKNQTGGTYCQKNSFKCDKQVKVYLVDIDFFKLMNRVSSYIRVWESQYGASLMITGRNAVEEQMNALKGAGNNEQAG